MSKHVERFTTGERVLHWFVTVTFFTLMLSGIGLYSKLFTGYFNLFGGGQNAIFFHKFAGVLFFCASIAMFFGRKQDLTTFDEDDKAWIAKRGGYLSREETHFNMGKYNTGQKIFGIFIGAATLIMGVSGAVVWFQFSFPRGVVQLSLMLHSLMFVLSMMFVVVHVYLATIGNPGTVEAMLYGSVGRRWAKHHHPKWLKEVVEEKSAAHQE
jgi:formate dehydrogenase subunit gamma